VISGGSSAKLPPPSTGTASAPGTPGTPGATGSTGAPGAVAQAPRSVLTIASKGELFLDSRPISDDALPRTLRDLASRSKDTQLVIRVDKNVTSGRVVYVMDHAKQAGLTRISLAIAP
jgi:biopolymer transport protein ExbD